MISYREEESLSRTWLEELLPLFCVSHGEGDGVDAEVELHDDRVGPKVQLQAKKHKQPFKIKLSFVRVN